MQIVQGWSGITPGADGIPADLTAISPADSIHMKRQRRGGRGPSQRLEKGWFLRPCFPMPQVHRWQRLVPGILAAGLAALPSGARAQDLDRQAFWYGFLLGSGSTVCRLLAAGMLGQNFADDWINALLKADADIPAVSLHTARSALMDGETTCPVPASPESSP